MTLILDSRTNFISGVLQPDDDYDMCNRGRIISFDGSNIIFSMSASTTNYLSNFTVLTVLSNTYGPANWTYPLHNYYGQAAFELVFVR